MTLEDTLRVIVREEIRAAVDELRRSEPAPTPPQPANPYELLTVAEVAKRWKMKPATVSAWCRSGKLDAKTVGGRYRISPEAMERFLAGSRSEMDPSDAADMILRGAR